MRLTDPQGLVLITLGIHCLNKFHQHVHVVDTDHSPNVGPSGTNTQPWQVTVLTGEAKTSLSARIQAVYDDPKALAEHQEEYAYYPTEWRSPFIERRRKVERHPFRPQREAMLDRLVALLAGVERSALEALGKEIEWLWLPAGETLLREGEPGDAVFFVLDGRLRVFTRGGGGAVVAIQRELGIPVKFIGVGEQLDDLQTFDAREFAEALLS